MDDHQNNLRLDAGLVIRFVQCDSGGVRKISSRAGSRYAVGVVKADSASCIVGLRFWGNAG